MNVVAYILSFCQKPERKGITEIEENIYILKQIYDETSEIALADDSDVLSETSDSEDDDYEVDEDMSDSDDSMSVESEEIIIRRDADGRYYIY